MELRLLKRGSFVSVEQLKQRILEFIEYFNKTIGKSFRSLGHPAEPLFC